MTDLATVLLDEEGVLCRFLELLRDEQGALKEGRAEALSGLADGKEQLIAEINSLEGKRVALAGGADRNAMSRALASADRGGEVSGRWQRVRLLSREAQQMNELNAKLLDLHLRKTSEALEILTRHKCRNLLYSADGQTSQLSASSIIESA